MPEATNKGVEFDLGTDSRFPPIGVNYLFTIGINAYLHCPRLYNCVSDAEALISLLTARYRFDNEHVITLFDEEATKGNIYDTFSKLTQLITSNDNLLIYFSGHGEYSNSFKQGSWIPVEAQKGRWEQYIPNSEITTILNAIGSHHTFLIVDSCFSGTLFEKVVGKNVSKRYEADPSRWVLTSGRNEIVSDGKPGDSSPFAEALLYNLRQNTGSLGVMELCARVVEHVLANSAQTPIGEPLALKGHKYGQFVFHLRKNEKRDWAAAEKEKSLEAYQHFLKAYPKGNFAEKAKQNIGSLEEEQLWQQVKAENTLEAYDDYLGLYPEGKYAEEAETNMEILDEEDAWKKATTRDSLLSYRRYLRNFPKGKYSEKAQQRIQELRSGNEKESESPGGNISLKDAESSQVATNNEKQHFPLKGMVFIEGGTFEMGNLFNDGYEDEKPIHSVAVSNFYMGTCQVTFDEFDAFCEDTGREKPNDNNWGRSLRPVIYVSWYDAIEYCNWLSRREELPMVYSFDGKGFSFKWAANGYRLPTEAEWEFAARERGKKLRFGNGKDIADPREMNFDGEKINRKSFSREGKYRKRTTKTGIFKPNSLGLCDMTGNVWEWCWDWFSDEYYENSSAKDPRGPSSGTERVLRGGAWNSIPDAIYNFYRKKSMPDESSNEIGFRLVRSAR